jgi:hypothetical protein
LERLNLILLILQIPIHVMLLSIVNQEDTKIIILKIIMMNNQIVDLMVMVIDGLQ